MVMIYISNGNGIFFHDVCSNNITFLSNDMGFNTVDLNNINFDDHFDDEDWETINHVRLMAWSDRFQQRKVYKKYK